MSKAIIEQLLYLLDEAFESEMAQSILSNLESLREEDWRWVPEGGGRSIADICNHVAAAIFMWENHSFGDGALTWEDPRWQEERSIREMSEWLREAYTAFRARVAALNDDSLLEPRPTHWGGTVETRRVIASAMEHMAYHAGEINHIRALHQGDDAWSW